MGDDRPDARAREKNAVSAAIRSVCFVCRGAHRFVISDPFGFGGAEVQQLRLAEALAARGIEPRYTCCSRIPGLNRLGGLAIAVGRRGG